MSSRNASSRAINGGRIICFVEDYEWVVEIRLNLRGKSIFSRLIRAYPIHTPTIPFTNQGKVKTWLLMSAMAIGRFAIVVKMTPKKSSIKYIMLTYSSMRPLP